MASYVVVDINNKALSTTDKAAIKSLTITGDVNKVSKENVFNIAIGGTYSKGVVVPLKVVTIDYTGVETSRVVWVKAGGSSEVAQTVLILSLRMQKLLIRLIMLMSKFRSLQFLQDMLLMNCL